MTTLHILKPLLDFGAGGVIVAIARQTESGVWVGGGCRCVHAHVLGFLYVPKSSVKVIQCANGKEHKSGRESTQVSESPH